MRALGMEPIDCIRAATTVAAETIGMPGVGQLKEGSCADLIGVPGDPLRIWHCWPSRTASTSSSKAARLLRRAPRNLGGCYR
jgi:imidazolonepropionase-like amidohydrolase